MSYIVPPLIVPLIPEAIAQSITSPPKLGVNPPGKTWLKTKQLGLAIMAANAVSVAEPAPVPGTGTTGHVLAAPVVA